MMAASVTIIVIPVMIVYVLLQKNIIKGIDSRCRERLNFLERERNLLKWRIGYVQGDDCG